jgi:diaminopimelate epimerase
MPNSRLKIGFAKYHGLGNDFVIINNLNDDISLSEKQISYICHRNFGIGADGLIFARRSKVADYFMDYYNSDGSIAEMCGNGIRCYAKYLFDENITDKETINIETRAGTLSIDLLFSGDSAAIKTAVGAKVDMGMPILDAEKIPVRPDMVMLNKDGPEKMVEVVDTHIVNGLFDISGTSFRATCVSMGNPHCITFVDDTTNAPVHSLGPAVETSDYFPQKTNVEFAKIISRNEIELRVWERGCGETLACGTGACATLVASVLNDKTDRSAVVHLPGGDLSIEWLSNNHIIMAGPATRVFTGNLFLELPAVL